MAIRVVLGLKTIRGSWIINLSFFLCLKRRNPPGLEIGMAKLIVPGRKLMKAKVKNIYLGLTEVSQNLAW